MRGRDVQQRDEFRIKVRLTFPHVEYASGDRAGLESLLERGIVHNRPAGRVDKYL